MRDIQVKAFEGKANQQVGTCVQYDDISEVQLDETLLKRLNEGIYRHKYLQLMALGKPKSEKAIRKQNALSMLEKLEKLAKLQGVSLDDLLEQLN